MPAQLYLQQDQPHDDRVFVLTSNEGEDGVCLTFRKTAGRGPTVQLALVPRNEIDLTGEGVRRLGGRVYGCLGLLSIGKDIFICVIDSASQIGSLARHENISRIFAVSFHCITSSLYDNVQPGGFTADGQAGDVDMGALYGPSSGTGTPPHTVEHPCAGIRKYLSSGSFYFSSSFDISSRLQARIERGTSDVGVYDDRFTWNSFAVEPLLTFRDRLGGDERALFDQAGFVVLAIQGFVSVVDLHLIGSSTPVTISLISRLGWKRAGTRFLTRGLDDEGHVANFVESETILRTQAVTCSFVQIRGSVPVFWEQQGMQPFVQKLAITRPQIASQPAFDRHLASLLETYSHLHILNLLGNKDYEAMLTKAYADHVASFKQSIDPSRIGWTWFDFHARARNAGGIENVRSQLHAEPGVAQQTDHFGYCMASIGKTAEETSMIQNQDGVFRTNCLDCLDRTNVVQDIMSRFALEHFVLNTNPTWLGSEQLWSAHRVLWAENGDALSKIYAGTGALNTSFTRSGRRTLAGAFADATKSVGRVIQANFADKDKQASVDGLLGNLAGQQRVIAADPIHDALDYQLQGRAGEFTSHTSATIFIGTWNLNAKPKGTESLLPWLFPDPSVEPDIMAIGFQELVNLDASQVLLATDPEKKRRWEQHIMQALAERPDRKAEYIIMRSAQLVGAALILLVKTSLIEHVRNIEVSTKKTGLKGTAGNKGAVAIRLDYRDSSICFVTAHLAAGHSNVDDRNHDYATITSGLAFLRGKTITSHDHVIWFGDFNYRINLPGEQVRRLAMAEDLQPLLEADQLSSAIRGGAAFSGYEEGPITFRPTYRYDVGTEDYDTSEKQRIPAWTDRIVYRGQGLDLNRYNRAELYGSDHRPVMAILRARIRVIDHTRQDQIRAELLAKLLADAPVGAPLKANKTTPAPPASRVGRPAAPPKAKPSLPSNGRSATLPPPSSEDQQWWNDIDAGAEFVPSTSANPFDEVASPSSYRKPAPVIPPRPQFGRKASTSSSLLDEQDGDDTKSDWHILPPRPPA